MQLRKQLDEVPVALRVIISGTPIQVSSVVLMPAGMPRWHLLGSCWGWPLTGGLPAVFGCCRPAAKLGRRCWVTLKSLFLTATTCLQRKTLPLLPAEQPDGDVGALQLLRP
jgi:hypothetical protein